MRRLILIILLFCTGFLALPVRAELVLIANPNSGIEQLNRSDVVNIYLGRYRMLASGLTADPLDQPYESEMREHFYRRLVDKSLSQISAYWARLVFSGKIRPPRVVDSPVDAVAEVARVPGVVAYVDRSQVDGRVRIVFDFGK